MLLVSKKEPHVVFVILLDTRFYLGIKKTILEMILVSKKKTDNLVMIIKSQLVYW
mgnify:CR=1 FL=1